MHAGWAAVGRKPRQAEGSRPTFASGYFMCVMYTIATPAPASKKHKKEKMPAFATTTTVHVRGPRMNQNPPVDHEGWMDGKWSGNSFLLGFSSLANHGYYLSCSLNYST
jgi:hypothetical protein